MKFLELEIRGFGKLQDRRIFFGDGINILYGHNEAGKSTLHTFIQAMLFGMERARGRASKTDTWARFEPWSKKNSYGGMLRLSFEGKIYRIERDFTKNAPTPLSIVNESDGVPVAGEKAFLDNLLGGLSEVAYANTISIGQLKSVTDAGMAAELRNYIANLNNTGSESLNITKASAYLKDQRRAFAAQIIPEAAKSYTSNLSEIKQLEEALSSPDFAGEIHAMREEKSNAGKEADALRNEYARLSQEVANTNAALAAKDFHTPRDVLSFKEECRKKQEDYRQAAEKYDKKKMDRFTWILSGLSLFFLMITFTLLVGGRANALTNSMGADYDVTLAILTWLTTFVIIALIVFLKLSSYNKAKFDIMKERLLLLIKEETSRSEISPESLEALNGRLDSYLSLFTKIDEDNHRLAVLSSQIESLNRKRDQVESKIETRQRSQWEMEKQLEHLSNLKDENAVLKAVIAENERLQFEINAIDIALETMSNLSATIRDSFGLYLNKEASSLIASITAGAYDSMSIDKDMNIFMNTSYKLIPMNQVSSGTLDQIYLALRLATAKVIQKETADLPLIFDDSFVNYDKNRLAATLLWLYNTYRRQIILFSCHSREQKILRSRSIAFTLIEI